MAVVEICERCVLVVDDNPLMRRVYKSFLKAAGFSVYCAANGREGIEVLKRNKSNIIAIVLDYCMPGLNGKETAELMNEINSSIPKILISGSLGELSQMPWLKTLFNGALQKPHQAEECIELIRRLTGSNVLPGLESGLG
ncbi:response regulator [Oligoflexia bacterium]|nr:response regulator [Oligoflexia bacterium]